MRSILKCNRFTSLKYMLKFLNVKQRLQLNIIIFIQKMKMGSTPDGASDEANKIFRKSSTLQPPQCFLF